MRLHHHETLLMLHRRQHPRRRLHRQQILTARMDHCRHLSSLADGSLHLGWMQVALLDRLALVGGMRAEAVEAVRTTSQGEVVGVVVLLHLDWVEAVVVVGQPPTSHLVELAVVEEVVELPLLHQHQVEQGEEVVENPSYSLLPPV